MLFHYLTSSGCPWPESNSSAVFNVCTITPSHKPGSVCSVFSFDSILVEEAAIQDFISSENTSSFNMPNLHEVVSVALLLLIINAELDLKRMYHDFCVCQFVWCYLSLKIKSFSAQFEFRCCHITHPRSE